MDQILSQIYYDPAHPASYGGAQALSRASGIALKDVQQWLKAQSAYTLHKPARKRYMTRRYRTSGINHLWQADLADMQPFATQNDGYRYIMTVIDVFSRKAWAIGIKTKKYDDVSRAFEEIFATGVKPLQCQSDQGMEFESNAMKAFFKRHGIEQFSVKSQFKASLVERFNRTLKTKMWRYFTHRRTRRWIDVLPQLVEAYNNSVHRMIGMAPNKVTADNEMEIWYANEQDPEAVKMKKHVQVGDHVRISKAKGVFEKGYVPSWSGEIFTVSKILNTKPVQVKVKDYNDEEIQGSFYLPEVQRVDMPEEFEIEEVLSKKRVNGRLQYYVKWLGYPKSMNSWVDAESVREL